MKFVSQPQIIKIINLDKKINESNKAFKRHGELLPNHIRCLIIGFSNVGKTNTLLNLLFNKNGVCFENIYIFSKSLNQPKYLYLDKIMSNLNEIGYFTFNNNEEIVLPEDALPNSVFIFDDIVGENYNIVKEYFTRSRHLDLDIFFLIHSYANIPKHLIRENANLLIIHNQDIQNLKHIHYNHVNSDMSFETFCDVCKKCWGNDHGFLVINKDKSIKDGRYQDSFIRTILL